MIANEILSSIDRIQDTQFESENCVMESMAYYLEKQHQLIEYYNESDDKMIQESFNSETDKNQKKSLILRAEDILKKIWEGIKNFFMMIARNISSIIAKIKLSAKKKTKSINTIIYEILQDSKYNEPDNIDSWEIPEVNKVYVNERSKGKNSKKVVSESFVSEGFKETPITDIEDGPTRVRIPAGPGSVFSSIMISMPKNGIVTQINDSNNKLRIYFKGMSYLSKTQIKSLSSDVGNTSGDVKGIAKAFRTFPKLAVYMIQNTDTRKRMTKLIDLALDVIKHRKNEQIEKFRKDTKAMNSEIKKIIVSRAEKYIDIPIKQLTEFQQWVTEITKRFDKFSNPETNVSELDKKTIADLNSVFNTILIIQMSLQQVSSALDNVSIIDEMFYKSVKNVAILDIFVNECVKEGVPPKFIAYNTWLISDECIRGNKEEYKPVFGQTRTILFPPNKKVVYKIAMSGAGITSNEAEIRTSKIFIDMGRVDLIAPIVKTWENSAVVAMQNIKGDDQSTSVCQKWKKEANDALQRYDKNTGKHLNIQIGDQHAGNCKFDTDLGIVRSIDYGIGTRSFVKNK